MAFATAPIQVTGLRELGETLAHFESKQVKKIVRKGLRAGAKVVRDEVRTIAPKRTGEMAKAFSVVGGGRRVKKGEVSVRLQVGKKWFVGDVFYAGFIEFGWKHGSRKLGDQRKQIPGRHFVERASESKAQAAVKAIVDTIKSEIDKAIQESKTGV